MSVKSKPVSAPSPLLKNTAAAPFVVFDAAPVHGTFVGNIEVELASRVLLPKADGNVAVDMVCVAHLRCSAQGAQSLLDALSHALEMHAATLQPSKGEPAQRLNS